MLLTRTRRVGGVSSLALMWAGMAYTRNMAARMRQRTTLRAEAERTFG